MDGALRGFADALLRAAKTECTAPGRTGGARCADPLCRVAALHDGLARDALDDVATELSQDVAVEYFGMRLPGFVRIAHGVDAAVALFRANESSMERTSLALDSATALGDTLLVFHREQGRWAGLPHAAVLVSHFQLSDGRISRVRVRAFPPGHPAVSDGPPGAGAGGVRTR
jgi:hypothetical protein